MEDLRVSDIMQREVVTVGPETTVRELAHLLAENKVSGVPVVDAAGCVVGMVSEADLVVQDADLHFPYYVQFLESTIYLQSLHRFEERFRRAFGTRVADVMTDEVVSVAPEDSVHEAATLMADRGVNRLPVLDNGKLVGIVTRGDIVRAIAEGKT